MRKCFCQAAGYADNICRLKGDIALSEACLLFVCVFFIRAPVRLRRNTGCFGTIFLLENQQKGFPVAPWRISVEADLCEVRLVFSRTCPLLRRNNPEIRIDFYLTQWPLFDIFERKFQTMNLQYITNSKGEISGVFIPIEDWELIKKELDLKLDIPFWHKEILAERLINYQSGNKSLMDSDSFLNELESGL
jgi:hypothetical protein